MAEYNEFKEYLKSSGGQDAIWKVLIKLDAVKNKPGDPVEYIRQNIDSGLTELFESLTKEIEELKEEISTFATDHPNIYAVFLKKKAKSSKGKRKGKK